MGSKTGGGFAIPVNVIQTADLQENGGEFKLAAKVAMPITNVSGSGRKLAGGEYITILPISQASVDSGEYRMVGGPAIPVIQRAGGGNLTGAVAAAPVLPRLSKR